MKISKAIERLSALLEEHGDMEFVYCDMDTDWSFVIQEEAITYYKGVCEIYMKDRYQSQEYHHDAD